MSKLVFVDRDVAAAYKYVHLYQLFTHLKEIEFNTWKNDMKIWGVTRIGLDFALMAGGAQYGGNLRFFGEPQRVKNHWRLRIITAQPGPGSKIYYKELHESTFSLNKEECSSTVREVKRVGPACCWHAHRDFMRAIFEINPEARIQTFAADYKGKEDFEENYPKTKATFEISSNGGCECE